MRSDIDTWFMGYPWASDKHRIKYIDNMLTAAMYTFEPSALKPLAEFVRGVK